MRASLLRSAAACVSVLSAAIAGCAEPTVPSAATPPSTKVAIDAGSAPVEEKTSLAADTAAQPPPAPPPPPRCGSSPWASYGHDPARTSASDGCVEGPLVVTWKMTRQGLCGYKFRLGRVLHVIAEENAIFAAVSCGGAPAVMRVSPKGEELWTFSRADVGRGTWPALAGDAILSTDDGVFLVDRETGKWRGRELDVWGEPIALADAFFVDNTFQLDGAGPFLGAFDASLSWKWKTSVISPGKGKSVPKSGGIAYAGGLVVHSAAMGARSVPSLSAHDASTGERRWLAPGSWPESAASIAEDRVFTIERWKGETADRLVARALGSGTVEWSTPIGWARGPAPVVAEKLVVVHGSDGVRAYDRTSGELVWTNPAPRKAAYEENATTMAAALGSRTLVVTSGPRVVVLNLGDGTERWSNAVVSGRSVTQFEGLTVERPVVVGRTVYVTSDGALLRLDPK